MMKKFILSLLVLLPLISACGDDTVTEEDKEETVVVEEEKPSYYEIAMKVIEANNMGTEGGEIVSMYEEESYESIEGDSFNTLFEKVEGETGSYKEYVYGLKIPNEAGTSEDSFSLAKVNEDYVIIVSYGSQHIGFDEISPDFDDREELLIVTFKYDNTIENTTNSSTPMNLMGLCRYRYGLKTNEFENIEGLPDAMECEEVASEEELDTLIEEFFEELYNIYW